MTVQRKLPLHVAGREIFDGETFRVVDPYDATASLNEVVSADENTVQLACDSALEAFATWRNTSVEERRKVLVKAADLLALRKDRFCELMKAHGLPQWFCDMNTDASEGMIREYARVLSDEGTVAEIKSHHMSIVINDPIGPVLSIAPWNAPLILSLRGVVAPLAAGCPVILKTSELSPEVHYETARLFIDAGVPPGTINVMHIIPDKVGPLVTSLISHDAVRKVTFTGSSVVGRIIAETAGRNLKPVLLELGGKSSVIVDRDADLEKAAFASVEGAWGHKGQICRSTERVFVHQEVADEFRKYAVSAAQKLSGNADLAIPQRTVAFAAKIESLVKNATDNGATFLYGDGSRDNSRVSPMLLENVDKNMDIADMESFGPVCYISEVESAEAAVQLINSGKYGLSTSVWSQNTLRAISLARAVESGAVHINGITVHDAPNLPHGGVKESGYGRFNSRWGLDEFRYAKTITLA